MHPTLPWGASVSKLAFYPREGFVEVRGRGCWHQIDCYFDYKYMIPFTYPIRMIGEAKFYTKRLSKRHIRSLIGVLKDIQENYYAEEGKNVDEFVQRRTEIGVFFAVNGFQNEAEKLAYARGIRTVSYLDHPLMSEIGNMVIHLTKPKENSPWPKPTCQRAHHRIPVC